jgi:hypothetical protein
VKSLNYILIQVVGSVVKVFLDLLCLDFGININLFLSMILI